MERTSLFVPAHDIRKMEKALNSRADSIILDLEDSIVPDRKKEARKSAINILSDLDNDRAKYIYVRVNDLSSPYILEDLSGLIEGSKGKLRNISVPKIETAYELKTIDWLLTKFEKRNNINPGTIRVNPTIETALGLVNIKEIASASSRIRQLNYGIADYASDLNILWPYNGMEQLHIRTQVVMISRAACLEAPLDSVWPIINDIEGLVEDSKTAKALGFQGKIVIHPEQIDPVNQVFSPTPEEIKQAQKILSEFKNAERDGLGAIRLENGQFVDYAFLEKAQKTVELAKEIENLDSSF